MAISVQPIKTLSFGAKTRNGNDYKKSQIGKLSGLVAGAGFAGYGLYKGIKQGVFKEGFKEFGKQGKLAKNFVLAFTIGVFALTGLGLGAIVDAIINSVRRNKADEKAEEAKEAQKAQKTE